ncbi:MAG: DUF3500 domain-containing protein [Myxococcales bacterium]|nr:DUF3500 domain-containing protein [Myxococcales bacterium]
MQPRSPLVSLTAALLCACTTSATSPTDGGASGADSGTTTTTDAGVSEDAGQIADAGTTVTDCTTSADDVSKAVCAAEAFLATLDSTQRDLAQYDFSDSANKTCWSNLPGQNRPGITLGALDDTSRAAAMAVADAVLSNDGYEDFRGVLAADDYLGQVGGGGGPGGGTAYTSDNAHIAIFGTPSAGGDWMISIGNHHMAYNITFVAGAGYPTPNHLGAEPRAEFTVDSETFGPLVSEGETFSALFGALSAAELSSAHLSGTFGDILLGPVEYCTGRYDTVVFPSGSERTGVLVSELTDDQQLLVTAAIAEWVADYDGYVSDALLDAYTSAEAYADTYVAWGGTGSAPDVTVNGTYFRIDGPRVWIEVACQNGVILSGTHYHTVYRDRAFDYGAEL